MNSPRGIVFDSVNKYLFVAQNNGRRITIYDVNEIVDGENAINVLGQANFTANVSTISQIGGDSFGGLDYDSTNGRLFAVGNNRLLIYNIADGIINGENASNVLGQTLFSTSTASTTQNGLSGPQGVLYDSTNNKIIVADMNNQRLMIFDTTTINNGENAVDLLGQYDDTSYTNPVPIYTKSGANNGPNVFGFSGLYGIEIDTINHRLFTTETSNNRVLIYNLNENNILEDKFPDYVLGQPNFYTNTINTTQSGLNCPIGISHDNINDRLFVAECNNNRVVVYDLADGIVNGENAINVLGQINFTTATARTTQNGISYPRSIFYDSENNKLFVVDQQNNRVLVFNCDPTVLIPNTPATDGPNAINVLGQVDFTHGSSATTQTGLNNPRGISYDFENQRLFIAEDGNGRVVVYNIADGITNGEPAGNVLGKNDFVTSGLNTTQNGMKQPNGINYDSINNRLFVGDVGNNRVLIFDTSEITNGEDAINVLGQADFITATTRTTQNGMNSIRELIYDDINKKLFVADNANNRILTFDLSDTTITSVSAPSDTYQRGDTIPISVTFSKVVNVTGTPTLTLETGDTDQIASYDSGSGTDTLIFNYEVQEDDEAEDLDYISTDALSLNGGTILDLYNGLPIFTLPIPGETGSLSDTSNIRVVIPHRITGSYIQSTNLLQQPTIPTVSDIIVPPLDSIIPVTPSSDIVTKIENIKTVLRPNTISDNVKLIQIYLNTHGYSLTTSGPGSLGNETNKYGKLTRLAVIKFQLANNLSPDGIVGPLTRGKMK